MLLWSRILYQWFIKLFCKYLKDISDHDIPPMPTKWANGKSRPSYSSNTHKQDDH